MSTPKRTVRRALFTNGSAAKRAKPASINSIVRKAVLRNAETKKKEFSGSLYGGGLTGVNSATFQLSAVAQGPDDGQRIGNKILCTGVDLQLYSECGALRVILYTSKDPSSTINTPPIFAIDDLLDLDSVNVHHDWIYTPTAGGAGGVTYAVCNYKNRRQFHTEYFASGSTAFSVKPLYCCIAPANTATSGLEIKGTIRMWYKDI